MVGLLGIRGRKWLTSSILLFNLTFFCLVSGEFVEVSEKIRLLELKNAISDPYGMLSSWKPANPDHCSWYGVTCNSQARVSELRIPGGNFHCSSAKKGRFLSGKLSNAIGDLSELRVLSISFHRIVGVLPESIWGLKNLEVIDIEGNSITGNISMINFADLKKLQVLNLGFNRFYGEIPKSLAECKGLRVINLAKNPIHGTIPGFAGGLRRSPPQPRRVLGGGKKTGFSSLEMVLGSRVINRIRTIPGFAGGLPPSPPQPRRVLGGFGSGKKKGFSSLQMVLGSRIINRIRTVPGFAGGLPPSPAQPRRVLGGSDGGKKGFSSVDVVLISAATLIVIVLITLIIAYFYVRHRRRNSRVDGVPSPPRSGTERLVVFKEVGVPLTFDTVIQATGNFTLRNCIGSGGFGSTYRAEISPGTTVAVKRLTVEMCQGVPQFNAEIRSLGKIRHPNLITLIGYYASSSEMFLVYNYLPGGSLEDFIREKRARTGLKIVHKLATEIAVALAFLHEDCNPRVLHRDVKPSNILLDDNLKPYLSDFGLSRLLEGFETHVTTGVAGTFGYVAPEYALACRASDKADVYSYGVMLLELISDKRALDPSFSHQQNGYTIVSWAGTLWREGRTMEVFATGMWDSGPENVLRELLELGLVCTHESAAKRPKMKQVVRVLRQLQSEFDL